MATDITQEMKIRGVVAMVDGLSVIKIPENRLPSKFGFMICHPVAGDILKNRIGCRLPISSRSAACFFSLKNKCDSFCDNFT